MRIKYNGILVLTLAIGLQSCYIGKPYNRPELEVSQQFRAENAPSDSTSWAEVSWREFFVDPQLVAYIEKALDYNLDIRYALQNMQIAEAYLKQSKAGNLPTINAGLNHTFNTSRTDTRSNLSYFQLNTNLAWEADIWGKIKSSKRGALADYLRSNYAQQAVATGVISAVAQTYFSLLALDQQKQVLEETIVNREESVSTNKALKVAGMVTEVAVNQNEALLLNAKTMVLDVDNAIRQNENALSILLGQSVAGISRNAISEQLSVKEVELGFPSQLLENRPDVKAAEQVLVKAFENLNVAKSNFYPALKISATSGFQNIDLAQLLDFNTFFANIVSGLTQPIYNRRALKTQREVATAAQEQAYFDFQKSLLVAGKEVSDALANYTNAVEKTGYLNQQLTLHQQSVVYSEELLKNGMSNYLEVITSKQNVLNSQLDIIKTQLHKLNASVDLYRALGGGWK